MGSQDELKIVFEKLKLILTIFVDGTGETIADSNVRNAVSIIFKALFECRIQMSGIVIDDSIKAYAYRTIERQTY